MTALENLFRSLERMGVVDILIPFVLVFTISFAVLKKSKILGKDSERFNIILALVLGLAVVFPHVTGQGPDIVPIINNSLPNVAVVAVAIIMLLFLLGLWGEELTFVHKYVTGVIVLASLGIIIYIFGASAGWGWQIPRALRFLEDPDTQAIIIVLLVFGVIVYYITRDPAKSDQRKFQDGISEAIGSIFKKK